MKKSITDLVKIRRAAQITLPSDMCRMLKLAEGDYLEATTQKGGVFLKPVIVVERKKKKS